MKIVVKVWLGLQPAGLAIYAAMGLRSRTTEFTAVAFTAQFFLKNEMRKLDIFQVASDVSLVAETGVRKKSVCMRKLKLRELNAENCVSLHFAQRFPGKCYARSPPQRDSGEIFGP